MKKMLLAAVVIIATSFTTLPGDALTKSERTFAVNYFNKTKERFLQDIKGLSAQQLNFKADSTRWSIAQCIEHIALAENLIWQWGQGMLQQPADPSKRSQIKFTNEKLIESTLDRTAKFKAPEQLQPVGKFANTDEALKAFTGRRDSTIAYIETTQDDLKNHFIVHPAFGTLDLYQGLLLTSAHCERHTLQIEEVKANPGFPK